MHGVTIAKDLLQSKRLRVRKVGTFVGVFGFQKVAPGLGDDQGMGINVVCEHSVEPGVKAGEHSYSFVL